MKTVDIPYTIEYRRACWVYQSPEIGDARLRWPWPEAGVAYVPCMMVRARTESAAWSTSLYHAFLKFTPSEPLSGQKHARYPCSRSGFLYHGKLLESFGTLWVEVGSSRAFHVGVVRQKRCIKLWLTILTARRELSANPHTFTRVSVSVPHKRSASTACEHGMNKTII